MKIAVIFFSGNGRQQLLEVSKGLAKGLEEQGKQVDLLDGDKDVNVKLTMYQYIAIGTSALGRKDQSEYYRIHSQLRYSFGKTMFCLCYKGRTQKNKDPSCTDESYGARGNVFEEFQVSVISRGSGGNWKKVACGLSLSVHDGR